MISMRQCLLLTIIMYRMCSCAWWGSTITRASSRTSPPARWTSASWPLGCYSLLSIKGSFNRGSCAFCRIYRDLPRTPSTRSRTLHTHLLPTGDSARCRGWTTNSATTYDFVLLFCLAVCKLVFCQMCWESSGNLMNGKTIKFFRCLEHFSACTLGTDEFVHEPVHPKRLFMLFVLLRCCLPPILLLPAARELTAGSRITSPSHSEAHLLRFYGGSKTTRSSHLKT